MLLIVVCSLKYSVIFFEKSSCRQLVTLANVQASFGASACAIYEFMQVKVI